MIWSLRQMASAGIIAAFFIDKSSFVTLFEGSYTLIGLTVLPLSMPVYPPVFARKSLIRSALSPSLEKSFLCWSNCEWSLFARFLLIEFVSVDPWKSLFGSWFLSFLEGELRTTGLWMEGRETSSIFDLCFNLFPFFAAPTAFYFGF